MSKNALRKLIRERELPEDEERLNEELYEGSDHTAVLLSVSQLQHALEHYVTGAFAVRDEDELEALTEPGGLLSSFHLLIQLGYALGLIDRDEREHLNRVRAIRNVFAHAMRPVGFHMKVIADEANKLPLSKEFTDEYPTCTARERFVFSTWQMGTELFRRSALRLKAELDRLKAEGDRLNEMLLK